MSAITPRGKIAKGKALENHVCEQLKLKGIDERAKRSYGSGNSNGEKSDIDTIAKVLGSAIGFECKHMDKINLAKAWRQTSKLIGLGYEPVLVYKQTADNYGDTKVILFLDTFLDMIKELNARL